MSFLPADNNLIATSISLFCKQTKLKLIRQKKSEIIE